MPLLLEVGEKEVDEEEVEEEEEEVPFKDYRRKQTEIEKRKKNSRGERKDSSEKIGKNNNPEGKSAKAGNKT